jgi:hypothetical protein
MDLGIPHLFAYDLETKDNGDRHNAIGPNPKGHLIVLPSSMMMMAIITPSRRSVSKTNHERALAF